MKEIRDITRTEITIDVIVAAIAAADKRHDNGWNKHVSGFPPLSS